MIKEPLVFVATSDLAGLTRGKAFAESELESRLTRGIGWVPTNALITCFDNIGDGPYGSLGDLWLVPDAETRVQVDFDDGQTPENFLIGNIVSFGGEPWECCTRGQLQAALTRLEEVAGLQLVSAFEHEFQLNAVGEERRAAPAFSLQGHRLQARFGEVLYDALRQSGVTPESFINEYGTDQYEVPIAASTGLVSADHSLILREIVYATAQRLDQRASFTPIRALDGVGNGVHIHLSLLNSNNEPVMYDPGGKHGFSAVAGSFVAGILKYMPEYLALTAASEISYQRLTPHRWSAAFNNLGEHDREAALRICPVSSVEPDIIARQFNVEYRAADASASPYLALAALVHAGVQGIEEKLETPEPTQGDLSLLNLAELANVGVQRLPQTLHESLDQFEHSSMMGDWFGEGFKQVYVAHKRAELQFLEGQTIEEKCAAYGRIY